MTESRTPRPHRPDPIAWGTVEALAGRAQTIAKGWLLSLLERVSLDAAGAIPAAALAAEGPALCAALARGLGSDVELARLRLDGDLAGGVRRIPALTGARDAGETVAAVDALRACLWAAALDGLVDPADAAATRTLAGRLAEVAATVAATALAGDPVPARSASHATDGDLEPAAGGMARAAAGPAPAPPARPVAPVPAPPAGPRFPDPAADRGIGDDRGIRDDRGDDREYGGMAQAGPVPPSAAPTSPFAPPPPATSSNGHLPAGTPVFAEPGFGQQPGPTLHDLRDDGDEQHGGAGVTQLPQRQPDPRHGPAGEMDDSDLWISTLERHIDRCQREGGGLALLRVELVDGERVAASAPEGEAHVPYGRLAQAIRRAIRRQDLVASDHQGRAWVIAPGVGRAGAIALAERIGDGVEHGETWRGAPLTATIGFAVYGEDGHDAATLIDRAEEAMLAANAAGVPIGEAFPHPGGDSDRPGPRLVR